MAAIASEQPRGAAGAAPRSCAAPAAHGTSKPYEARIAWPSSESTNATNAVGHLGVGRLGERGDRVGGGHVLLRRDLDALDRVTGGQYVGPVDDPGVELAGLDLGEQRADVGLVGVDRRRHAGVGERLAAELPAGDLLGAEPDQQVAVGEVGEPGDAGRVAGRDGDLELVLDEARRIGGRSGFDDLVHVGRVGRREDVSRRAGEDLLAQGGRAREVERRRSTPSLAPSNAAPISSKASVSDAAANTVMSPSTSSPASSSSLHAANSNRAAPVAASRRERRSFMFAGPQPVVTTTLPSALRSASARMASPARSSG